jgi:hypothetical protein
LVRFKTEKFVTFDLRLNTRYADGYGYGYGYGDSDDGDSDDGDSDDGDSDEVIMMVIFMVMVMTHGMLAGNIPIYRNDILYIRRQQSIHWM